MSSDIWNWVLHGLKKPNRNFKQKTTADEGTSNYVNEGKRWEILLKERIVEEFHSGRMLRDDLKALEIFEEFIKEPKELEKKMKEHTAGENKHKKRENAVTEVLKLKAYQPKSEIEDAATIDELMLPYSVKAQEVVAGAQTGDVGMKGMTMCIGLKEAKFQISTIGARSVHRGSAEMVAESRNVRLGRCLMDR